MSESDEQSTEPAPLSEPEAVLAEFKGDALAAIAALLHDMDVLARDAAESTSFGYVRGRLLRLHSDASRKAER